MEMDLYGRHSIGRLVAGNPYVGRGIVIGKTPDGNHAVCAYFIMGRSDNSRNRVFTKKDGAVYTEPFDLSCVRDPSLIIYTAVREYQNKLIVTNGDQTDTVYKRLIAGESFREALASRCFEPDAPNFTPRISGLVTFGKGDFAYSMSILKSIDSIGSACARYTFDYPAMPGLGHFIHTYVTDGTPLPTFCGEPCRVDIPDDIGDFTSDLWENLNEENKISLWVRYTDLADGSVCERIINKRKPEDTE